MLLKLSICEDFVHILDKYITFLYFIAHSQAISSDLSDIVFSN